MSLSVERLANVAVVAIMSRVSGDALADGFYVLRAGVWLDQDVAGMPMPCCAMCAQQWRQTVTILNSQLS